MSNTWVYIQSEPELWTTGFYDPSGAWHSDSDYNSKEEAAKRVHYLNGGEEEKQLTECERRECSYYLHYLLWWNTEANGPKLEHEAYHEAERRCAEAQTKLLAWMDEHQHLDPVTHASHLWRQAEIWEKKVAA